MIVIHFDEADDARALVEALVEVGHQARAFPDAFAGEDDLDDRAWIVEVDRFDAVVTQLAEVHGGWIPHEDSAPSGAQLPDLPQGPKRLKRD